MAVDMLRQERFFLFWNGAGSGSILTSSLYESLGRLLIKTKMRLK